MEVEVLNIYRLKLFNRNGKSSVDLFYCNETDANEELKAIKEAFTKENLYFEPDPQKEISGIKWVSLENVSAVQIYPYDFDCEEGIIF